MQRVLEIQELFERILQHLPTRDLLLAQRVSCKWRNTISTAPMLQQALFFRSSNAKEYRFNELLAQVFPLWFLQSNPHYQRFKAYDFTELPWAEAEEWRRAVLYQHASWRRMFVCQPALRLVVKEISSGQGGERCREGRLRAGVGEPWTMGLLYDLTSRWIFSHVVASFGAEWFCYPRPCAAGIEHDAEKRAVYDEYMGHGLQLADVANAAYEDEFKPVCELRLNLAYVVQCGGYDFGPRNVDGRIFLFEGVHGSAEEDGDSDADYAESDSDLEDGDSSLLVFGEAQFLPEHEEYVQYVTRKTRERLAR